MPFITFEGSEGCGKSTQVQLLARRLENANIPMLVTREPGGTPIGESIRELLQFAPQSSSMTPETELLLFEASRAQLVHQVIRPALECGKCVIADRFFDSTTVYQGVARRLDPKIVSQLNAFVAGGCIPDVTFFLDVDFETARTRMRGPRRPDRMEQQSNQFYEDVIEAYRQLAKEETDRVVLIDGSQSADEISDQIWKTLIKRFRQLTNASNIKTQTSNV